MAVNQRGSGQWALRRDRGDRASTDGALHATTRADRDHQGPHQLPLVASGGMMLKNSSAGFGIIPLSEGPGEAEHVLGDVGEDVVRRDRGDLVETRLAELALYVVLGVEAVAAEGLKGGVGRLPRGVGGQELRQVRLGAARLPPVEEGGCLLHHQRGGLDVRVGPCYGELDALVLADPAPEHRALAGALCGLLYEPPPAAHALCGDEDKFSVHAVDDVAETFSLFTDNALRRES